MSSQSTVNGLSISSPVFSDGSPIPMQYSCQGQDINPPLNILGAPDGTQSLVLIMHDPDAPSGDYLHWLVWDIPPSTESIAVSDVPVGAVQGSNSGGRLGYMGPCPPSGTGAHRYIFEVYALDKMLNLPRDTSKGELLKAMEGHTLAHATLTGLFGE